MTKKTNEYFRQIDEEYYLQTFKRFPIVLERGSGSEVWDIEGNKYIDALAGIAVNTLGHGHPVLVRAISEQAEKLIHVSNFFLTEPQAQLSKKLYEISGFERVFLGNSGAEAVEGAIKLARKYAHSIGRGGNIITFTGAFHGRTLATLTATGKKSMQEGFEPLPEGFVQLPFNDIEAVKENADDQTAAILVEPIQGEGGINVADQQFLENLRQFATDHDIVLIFDEIQCGMGRTGKWFASNHFGVQPDIMTLAKGLAGGVPIGAILANQKTSDAIHYGDHGTTFGGNPLACAAALAVIRTIEADNLLVAAHEKGLWLTRKLRALAEPSIREIKGLGLMRGVEFDFETKDLVLEMLKNGVIANATAGNILRLVPALNITYEQLEMIVETISKSLKTIQNNG